MKKLTFYIMLLLLSVSLTACMKKNHFHMDGDHIKDNSNKSFQNLEREEHSDY